jgi:hypothetical protein
MVRQEPSGNSGVTRLMECHDFRPRHVVPALADGTVARGVRCGAVLRRLRASSLDHACACACTGLVPFLIADVRPFLSMEISGRVQQVHAGTWFWNTAGISRGHQPTAPALPDVTMRDRRPDRRHVLRRDLCTIAGQHERDLCMGGKSGQADEACGRTRTAQ